ncbi:MAG: sensor histidine kinase [Chloroflexota bacterium]|nr:MAG: sensor histidine kinase [Chloroflexota bacterium]
MTRLLSWLDNLPLQSRISLLVSLGLISVLALLTVVALRVVQDTTDRIVHERLVITQMTATYVETLLQEAVNDLSKATTFASFNPERGNLSEEEHLMAHTYGQLGNFTQGLILVDRHGIVALAHPRELAPIGHDLSGEPYIRDTLGKEGPNVSNAFRNPLTDRPTVAVTIPVHNSDGEIVSYLTGLIDLTSPAFAGSLTYAQNLGRTGHADLLDARGIVVASSGPEHVLHPGEHPEFYQRMLREQRENVEATPYVEDGQVEGVHVMAFVPLKLAPWGIGLGGTEEETYAPVRRVQTEASVVAVLSLLLALVFVWFTTRRVVRPVEALITASEQMASGDLSRPISISGGGEIGRLAGTFDTMRLKLQSAYHALRMEKSQYQGIFRSIADAVFTVDTKLYITSFNPAAAHMLGWTENEVLGRTCEEALGCQGASGVFLCKTDWSSTSHLESLEFPASTRLVVHTRCGDPVTVGATQAPIFDDDGHLVGLVHVLRDISAQEQLDRMKEQFISNVSHELRSPLGHIKGYATTLLRRDASWDEKTQRRFIGEIVQGSERMQKLVNELLDMSRLEAGRFAIEKQPIQVGHVARAAVKTVRSLSKKHKFVVSMPQSLPRAQADPHHIEQVLVNLLENAVKYSPEGGCISVLGSTEDGTVVVSVADEGIGIAEDQWERVFERFQRVDSSLTRQVGGVGLGLSICRKIIQAHGGRIWVESKIGQGSTFYFSLPIFRQVAQRDQESLAHKGGVLP